MITTGLLESFFKTPASEPSPDGDGVLYHLRRDLNGLLGPESQHINNPTPHAMLSLMGILATIDYLSQVYSSLRSSRQRFVETVRELCAITEDDSEALYQLRCAIMHAVALSTVSTSSYRKGVMFTFQVADDSSRPLISKSSDDDNHAVYHVSFWKLRQAFLDIVAALKNIAVDTTHSKHSHVINMIGKLHSEKILKKE